VPGSKTTPFAIGSDVWPGLAKLSEECGELTQVIGKIMAFPDPDAIHPDGQGKLHDRLTAEMADVMAACEYVMEFNSVKKGKVKDRIRMKIARFVKWHNEEQR
jgi:NTP pyrophosphatase (non-canonical NTP hydrolase)